MRLPKSAGWSIFPRHQYALLYLVGFATGAVATYAADELLRGHISSAVWEIAGIVVFISWSTWRTGFGALGPNNARRVGTFRLTEGCYF